MWYVRVGARLARASQTAPLPRHLCAAPQTNSVLAASRAAAYPPALSAVRACRAAQAPGDVQQASPVHRVGTAYPGLSYTPAPSDRSPGQELQGKQTLGQSGGSQAAQSAAGTDCAGSHTWSAKDGLCASLPVLCVYLSYL